MRPAHPIVAGLALGGLVGGLVGVAEAAVLWSAHAWVGRGAFSWAVPVDALLGAMLGGLVGVALRRRNSPIAPTTVRAAAAGCLTLILGAASLPYVVDTADTLRVPTRLPKAQHPLPDVYWVLLDGVRAADVQPQRMPSLHELASQSVWYNPSYASSPDLDVSLRRLRGELGEHPFAFAQRAGYATVLRLPASFARSGDPHIPDLPNAPAGLPPSTHLLPLSGRVAQAFRGRATHHNDARRVAEVASFLERYRQPRFVSLILRDAAAGADGLARTDAALDALVRTIREHARADGYRIIIQGLRGRSESPHPLGAAPLAVPALFHASPEALTALSHHHPTATQVMSLLREVVPDVANPDTFPHPITAAADALARDAASHATTATSPILQERWAGRPPPDAATLAYVEIAPFVYADQRPCGSQYRSPEVVAHRIDHDGVRYEAIRAKGYTLLRTVYADGTYEEQLFDHHADPQEQHDLLSFPDTTTCDGVSAGARAAQMRQQLSSDG